MKCRCNTNARYKPPGERVWPRATDARCLLDAGVGTTHRPLLFPSVPKYFCRPLSCVQVDVRVSDGIVSFICSLVHCFPLVSICHVACRSANSKMCYYRLACACGRAAHRRRRRCGPHVAIHQSRSNVPID